MKFFLEQNGIIYKEKIPLQKISGMNQKGILPLIAYPDSVEKLKVLVREIFKRELSYDIFGGLTNTYLCESYKRDIVVITTKVQDLTDNGDSICVGCGYNLTKLSKTLANKGISGYEGFIGIPGTVGAAAINNSGAFSSSMSKVVIGIHVFNGEKVAYLDNSQLQYTTRHSILKGDISKGIVLSVVLDTTRKESTDALIQKIAEISRHRKTNIDGRRKSLGSVFVSSTLKELYNHHKVAMSVKKICNQPFKILFRSKRINTYLDFIFLGKPWLAKHCDSLNRFCWDRNTTEEDFFDYIKNMQELAHNKLTLEIEIKK